MKYKERILRHELKYYVNEDTLILLRKLLKTFMNADENMSGPEGYLVSSIYFDDIYNSAMQEKLAGIKHRRKYRIRAYDLNEGKILLECKEKFEKYISKRSVRLTKEEYDQILLGNVEVFVNREEKLCKEFYVYSKTRLLHPVVVVEYLREAYTIPTGNVRVTFDKEISASVGTFDMFSEEYITTRALEEGKVVLEVKYDDFLPEYIRQIISTVNTEQCAISKYVMCREEKRRVTSI